MISVILPNYNHAPFLKQRIDTILNQTYQDFELIILDDNSTDNSKEIIESYRGNKHISHIVYNDVNSGSPFKQWSKGIKLAKGEYIWIAESDDYADITFLQKSIDQIKINNAILCFSLSNIVDKEGYTKDKRNPLLPDNSIDRKLFLSYYMLYYNGIYNASSVVFKKSLVENIDWKPVTKLRYCGDWRFWSSILLNGNGAICEIKEYLNNYRMHDINVSNNSQKNGLDFLEGFPISVYVAKALGIKRDSFFTKTWLDINRVYIKKFNIKKWVQLKTWLLFIKLQPYIIVYLLKQLLKKGFR